MSIIRNSKIADSAKIYSNVKIVDSEVGDFTTIGDNSNLLKSILHAHVAINRGCVLDCCEMGFGSYINQNTTLKNVHIGKFCCISWNVTLYGGSSHNYTAPSCYTKYHWKNIFGESCDGERGKEITNIGNDVWIGNGAIIINGVTVGDGAIIGAGAVVTKDVEPYTVVAGVPAKPIRKRFDENTIAELLHIQWWNWPREVIRENERLLRIEELTTVNLERMRDITNSTNNI